MQHLERNEPLMLDVLREINRGHPATTQLAIDCIRLRKRTAQSLEWKRHGHIARGMALNRGRSRIESKSES